MSQSVAFFYLSLPPQMLHTCPSLKVKVKVTQSCPTLCNPMHYYSPWNSPGQNTGVGSLSLLQGISLTQGSKPALLHCRWILYQLSHSEGPSCNHLIYSWPMHISALIILRDSIGCFFYLFCFLPGWGTYPTHRLGQIKAEPQGLCN